MRPGDFIVVTPAEVELLTSDAFVEVASTELTREIRIMPTEAGVSDEYKRLALPNIGTRVVEALRAFAAGDSDANRARVAEHLADEIEQRITRT